MNGDDTDSMRKGSREMENFEEAVRRHTEAWHAFARLLLWSTVSVVVVLVLMAIFLL